jgi:hypothetical protein
MPGDPDNDEDDEGPDPELLAMNSIIERLKEYVVEHRCRIKVTFHVDFCSQDSRHLKEQYSFVAIPIEKDKEKFKQLFRDANNIIGEEMRRFFPDDAVKDGNVPVDPKALADGDITDIAQYMDEITEESMKKNAASADADGFMSLDRLLDIDDAK